METGIKYDPSDHPSIVVFPPALFLGTFLLGLVPTLLAPVPLLPPRWGIAQGLLLFALAAALAIWGKRTMQRAGTNVHPGLPALALVEDGPFRFSRNPLYLALTVAYCGLTLVLNSAWLAGLLVPLLLVAHFGIVIREERYLEAKFGEPYRAYRTRVRRWF